MHNFIRLAPLFLFLFSQNDPKNILLLLTVLPNWLLFVNNVVLKVWAEHLARQSKTFMPDGVWMSKIIIPLSKADALFFALAVSLFSVQIIFSTEVGGYLLQIYLFSRKKWIYSMSAYKEQWNWLEFLLFQMHIQIWSQGNRNAYACPMSIKECDTKKEVVYQNG